MYTTRLPHKVELCVVLCVVVVHKAANPIQLDDSMILLLLEYRRIPNKSAGHGHNCLNLPRTP